MVPAAAAGRARTGEHDAGSDVRRGGGRLDRDRGERGSRAGPPPRRSETAWTPGTAARTIAASRLVEAAALGVLLVALAAGGGSALGWRTLAAAVVLSVGALSVLRWLPWLRPFRADGHRAPRYPARQLLAPLALATAAWSLQWATYHLSILAVHARVAPYHSAIALLVANLGGILRLTPANVGVVQGALVASLAPAGVPAAQAVAAGLALQAVQVLPVLLIGMAVLGRHGMREAILAARAG